MISLKTAQHIVLKHATLKKAMVLKVVDTAFRVLAQDVYSRQDSPPFDKSIVDGFAVRLPDTRRVPKIVEIIETVFAGQRPRKSLKRGACVRIATGAMVSRGAGAIVKKEETRVLNARHVRILQRPKLYENILRKSVDFKKGDLLLRKGTQLNRARAALLSSQGFKTIKVFEPPSVAIVATGNEIKDPGLKIKKGEIWNAVSPMLIYALREMKIEPVYLGVVRDDPDKLFKKIKQGLRYDILILSGAVSVGEKDFVLKALKKVRLTPLVHKIAIRPGKPFLFACRRKHLVFGLPGNPLASLACFALFIKPVIQKILGFKPCLSSKEGILKKSVFNHSQRLSFLPARLIGKKEMPQVTPLRYSGSADLWAAAKANTFLMVGKNQSFLKEMSKIKFINLEQ